MKNQLLAAMLGLALDQHLVGFGHAQVRHFSKGYDIEKTGLFPRYPKSLNCSPLTSLYASWDDVDGSKRNQQHSGVDGGRAGEPILAPAAGVVRAVWKANWGWGWDGALLIRHSRDDVKFGEGAKYYYSEFDHLRYEEIQSLMEGSKISRGQKLGSVSTPGGKKEYLPEVHWEVWEVGDDSPTTWSVNKFQGRYWTNETSRLIDPLYMLSRTVLPDENGNVDIQPYNDKVNFRAFHGFTYILPCVPKTPTEQE